MCRPSPLAPTSKTTHRANVCRFKSATYNFCKKTGHLELVCRKKAKQPVKRSNHQELVHAVSGDEESLSKLEVQIKIRGMDHAVELDTATNGNFLTERVWKQLGRSSFEEPKWRYESASKHSIPVLGTFVGKTKVSKSAKEHDIRYIVSKIPDLNLLGRDTMKRMGISVDQVLHTTPSSKGSGTDTKAVFGHLNLDKSLHDACQRLCDKFPDLWKAELGCLKDVEVEVKFKTDAKPGFRKARAVPFGRSGKSLRWRYCLGASTV